MAGPRELRDLPDVDPQEHAACESSVLSAVRQLFVEQKCVDAAIGFLPSKGCYIARVETAAAARFHRELTVGLLPRKVEVLTSFRSPNHRNVMFRVHDP